MATINRELEKRASESYRKSDFYRKTNPNMAKKFRNLADKIVEALEFQNPALENAFRYLGEYEQLIRLEKETDERREK